jgi:hypothetical protein
MIGALLLLIIFTFPETSYNRVYDEVDEGDIYENKKNPYRLSLSIILDDEEKARVARYFEENDRLADEAASDNNSAVHRMEDRIRRLEIEILGINDILLCHLASRRRNRTGLSLFFSVDRRIPMNRIGRCRSSFRVDSSTSCSLGNTFYVYDHSLLGCTFFCM